MGKDRPLPTPAVSKAGLKVKIQLLISNWERKQSVPSLTSPPHTHTHARTLTPPQPSSPKPWLGAGAQGQGSRGCPTRPGHRGQRTPGVARTRTQPASRAPPLLPSPQPPPCVYTGSLAPRPARAAPRPDALSKRGPCRISAKLHSGGCCREKAQEQPRPAPRARSPLPPHCPYPRPVGRPLPHACTPAHPPTPADPAGAWTRSPGRRAAAVFSAKVKTKAADKSRLL